MDILRYSWFLGINRRRLRYSLRKGRGSWKRRGLYMVQFDNQNRLLKVKIVYYGPALGGKTTSLQWIHQRVDPERRTRLYSLNTANDRTLFFDLMSLKLGRFRKHEFSLQLYTVPGQVQYNATRRAVLAGADGVVFVADSQAGMLGANVESLENLYENLKANRISASIPLVFQFNKQDLPNLSSKKELEAALNRRRCPSFPTVATRGEGVMEAFSAVVEASMAEAISQLGGTDPDRVASLIAHRIHESFAERDPSVDELPQQEMTVFEGKNPGSEEGLGKEALIEEAVKANVQMSELNDEMEKLQRRLQHQVAALFSGAGFARELGETRKATKVLDILLDSALEHLSADCGAIFLVEGGILKEFRLKGLGRDPLLAQCSPLVSSILNEKRPLLVAPEPDALQLKEEEEAIMGLQFSSSLLLPLVIQGRSRALMTLYRKEHRLAFGDDELQLGMMMAQHAGAAFSNISNWKALQEQNQDLEKLVASRTAELQKSLKEVQKLNIKLKEKHEALEHAYVQLAKVDRLKEDILTNVSHELRTPVSSILTAATILSEIQEASAGDDLRRFVGIIHDETEHLSELIDGMIQATEVSARVKCPEKRETGLKELCKRTMAPLLPLADEREVKLSLKIAGKLLVCDPESLMLALREVVKNAILFSPRGESVTVQVLRRISGERSSVSFRVDDSGPGIPAEDRERVFDAFFQGGNLMTEKPPGVGLGLTTARRVIELHGGEIRLGKSPTGGTRVEFSIPG